MASLFLLVSAEAEVVAAAAGLKKLVTANTLQLVKLEFHSTVSQS